MKNHIVQGESSHFPQEAHTIKRASMDENDKFRANLIRLRLEREIDRANLSRLAGLNIRAVADIEEGRAVSPKISTVFALARALGVSPSELMGLEDRARLEPELVEYLSQYSEEDQKRLLLALAALPRAQP